MRLVSARAYRAPAVSIASDLADDLKAAGDVPNLILSKLVPDDANELRRSADAVALRFIDEMLAPRPGEAIAVIALIDQQSPEPRLVLLLLRGLESQNAGRAQRPMIAGVLFGDLDQAVRAK